MSAPLELEDTVPAGELRHRLALGLAFIDPLTGLGALGPLRVDLESIGPYRMPRRFDPYEKEEHTLRFDAHGNDKHALRYAGQVRKLLDAAIAGPPGTGTQWVVRVQAPRGVRNHVPRRLRLQPALVAGQPAPTPLNIRTPWLWPGANYPLPSTGTTIRGRVLRGPTVENAAPIPWARVFAAMPADELVFANAAAVVGWGHGDERGEFAVALDRSAMTGAALTKAVDVRLWAFFPPPAPPADPADPLDRLPIEDTGLAIIDDVLRGRVVPPAYTQSQSAPLAVTLGETLSGDATTLLFI